MIDAHFLNCEVGVQTSACLLWLSDILTGKRVTKLLEKPFQVKSQKWWKNAIKIEDELILHKKYFIFIIGSLATFQLERDTNHIHEESNI